MRFTQGFIEEIKYRNPIENVVSSYVSLKRSGSNLSGLCPFHNEKTPSFYVFPNHEDYHCFGCGAGGDVITFIMSVENLDYPSAVEFLCKRAGMEMPADSDRDKSELVQRARLYELNKEAARFFRDCLSGPDAEIARAYLKKRELSPAVIRRFGLGYAPKTFDTLRHHLQSLGYTDEELRTAFLCGKSEKNGKTYFFDYFRGRVIFPIIDNFQNVIAFGGRAIEDGDSPKYLNTSDTPVFKKSRNLFALNFARSCCSDYLILCEGYMDVISVHAAGFSSAVATLGTALTPEQARIMAKYTKKVILAYDSDDAGTAATKRAIPILTEAGLEVKVLRMQGAKDPDEYIKKYGADKFRLLLEGSSSKLDFLCESVLRKYNILVPEEKVKAAGELCAAAAEVYSDVEREVYMTRIADVLALDKESIKNDVKRLRSSYRKKEENEEKRKIVEKSLGYGDRVNKDFVKNVRAAKAEETILGILLLYPELINEIKSGKIQLAEED
ncbi:MAG: DNA primase, partial [Ruminococcus sp.]|nr:DNA primase [Candidatus Apopatosoma intestinale]